VKYFSLCVRYTKRVDWMHIFPFICFISETNQWITTKSGIADFYTNFRRINVDQDRFISAQYIQ